MEPVPVTRKVRRIVRMAVALVVGQAMLCAVIGWLTLGQGRSEHSRAPGSAVVDQLAAPPLIEPAPPTSRAAVVPTRGARKPAPASARPVTRDSPAATTVPVRPPATTTAPPATTPTSRPVPIVVSPEAPTTGTPPPSPPASSPSPEATSVTPLPSATSGIVQEPVRVGDECRPVGSSGRTATGEAVRCVGEWGQRARWKIV